MKRVIHHRSAFLILSSASMMLLVGLLMFAIPLPAGAQNPQPGPPEEPTGPVPGRSVRNFKPGAIPKPLPRQSAPAAPPLSSTIEGINFDEDATNSGYYHIPPDPIGAAGPNHVVSIVNTSIEWHTKAGSQQNSQRLGHNGTTAVGSFFQTLSPVNSLFDPKVIYDQYNSRFVVVALEQTDTAFGEPSDTSRILLAVSDDSDPNGTWYFHAINSLINIGGSNTWADYPGFAIDNQAVYVVANMFTFGGSPTYGGALLWIINKTPFYAGGAASVNVYDPSGAVGQFATTTQPAHMFGTPPSGVGTFLVRYSGYSVATIEYLSVIRVDYPLTTTSFSHQFIYLGNVDDTTIFPLPDAPQPMTTTLIETNDRRALHAVWRNNSLWASTTVVPPSGSDSGQATAYWIKVNTSNLALLTVADQGNAGGNDIDAGAYTYFPSIAVDQFENMALGFALSSPNHYPGAYFTGRLSTDPAGTVQATNVLAAGLGVYKRTFLVPLNRWGDYSGISLDPDGKTFWIFNEYALTPGTIIYGESGRWGTRWGSFSFYNSPLFLPLILK